MTAWPVRKAAAAATMHRARHTPSTVALDNGIFPYDTEALAEKVQQLRRVRNEQVPASQCMPSRGCGCGYV